MKGRQNEVDLWKWNLERASWSLPRRGWCRGVATTDDGAGAADIWSGWLWVRGAGLVSLVSGRPAFSDRGPCVFGELHDSQSDCTLPGVDTEFVVEIITRHYRHYFADHRLFFIQLYLGYVLWHQHPEYRDRSLDKAIDFVTISINYSHILSSVEQWFSPWKSSRKNSFWSDHGQHRSPSNSTSRQVTLWLEICELSLLFLKPFYNIFDRFQTEYRDMLVSLTIALRVLLFGSAIQRPSFWLLSDFFPFLDYFLAFHPRVFQVLFLTLCFHLFFFNYGWYPAAFVSDTLSSYAASTVSNITAWVTNWNTVELLDESLISKTSLLFTQHDTRFKYRMGYIPRGLYTAWFTHRMVSRICLPTCCTTFCR